MAKNNGNLIKLILEKSIRDEVLVEISMKSGKSYVGLVNNSGIISPQGDCDISLVPVLSGYRETETKKLNLEVNYSDVLKGYEKGNEDFIFCEDFKIAIPSSEIQSARLFYKEVYDCFQKEKNTSIYQATKVWFAENEICVLLVDGREIRVPLDYYPFLVTATKSEREKLELFGEGTGIHFTELDEFLEVRALVLGLKSIK